MNTITKRMKSIRKIIILLLCVVLIMDCSSMSYGSTNSKSKHAMRIYAFYLKRASGSANNLDRYGDATLIKSGGKYLLIDAGEKCPVKGSSKVYNSNLVRTLKKIGVKELDVYISHLHSDHIGGLKYLCDSLKVNKVYLPDKEIAKKYETPNTHTKISAVYSARIGEIRASKKSSKAEIVYLSPSFRKHKSSKATNKIKVGSVTGTVIGPVGDFTISQFESEDGNFGTKQGHYLNNYSLVTKFKCGKITFLACGDIEKAEEELLIKKYGTSLNADIMKVPHHGLNTSNTNTFYAKVTPRWSFMHDHGYADAWMTNAISLSQKYGFSYQTAKEKKNFIIRVYNNTVKIYMDSNNNGITDEKPYRGFVQIGNKYQYYSKSGVAATGWKKIKEKIYYFSSKSGFRYTGTKTIGGVQCEFSDTGVLSTRILKPGEARIGNPTVVKGKQQINIRWVAATNATGYRVYRSNKKDSGYKRIATVKGGTKSYKDKGLKKGSTYYYKVRPIRDIKGLILCGPYSDIVKARVR